MAEYRFGDCELDAALFELRVRGQKVAVQPKVLKLLLYLVRNRDRAVTRAELLREIWEDAKVERSSLSRVIVEARRAIGDDAHEVILTVRTHGFRFAGNVTEVGADARPSPVPRAPFVGRDACMTALAAGIDRAFARRGGVAWISGEAGIGKTRVLDELATIAAARGVDVAIARCHDAEGQPPFWPWSQLVKSLAETGAGDHAPLARAGELLDGAAPAEFKTFDVVTRAIVAASAARPVLLVIDDLQWADAASLQLLRFFARELQTARVLVVCAYRDTSLAGDERARALGALLSEYGSLSIPLRGLSREDTARLVFDLKGVEPTSELVSALHERTGGSPLFIHQMLGTEWAKRAL